MGAHVVLHVTKFGKRLATCETLKNLVLTTRPLVQMLRLSKSEDFSLILGYSTPHSLHILPSLRFIGRLDKLLFVIRACLFFAGFRLDVVMFLFFRGRSTNYPFFELLLCVWLINLFFHRNAVCLFAHSSLQNRIIIFLHHADLTQHVDCTRN